MTVLLTKAQKTTPAQDKLSEFRAAEGLEAKEQMLAEMTEEFPPDDSNFGLFDLAYADLAARWYVKGEMKRYAYYTEKVRDRKKLYNRMLGLVRDWISAGENFEKARGTIEPYLAEVIERTDELEAKLGDGDGAVYANHLFMLRWKASYLDTYAFLLLKLGEKEQALEQADLAIEIYRKGNIPTEASVRYATILVANGKIKQALDALAYTIEKGVYDEAVMEKLSDLYPEVHGDMTGYNDYVAALKDSAYAGIYDRYINEMKVDSVEKAPSFTLQNLDGESVSLDDYRGKVVILDFWATWCGPCKATFPGMQQVVDAYEDDSEVEILFIDTWETIDDPETAVREYLEEEGYTFHVLMDNKSNVVNEFGISMIPAKFAIDRDGNILLKSTGSSASDGTVFQKTKAMIEYAETAAQ